MAKLYTLTLLFAIAVLAPCAVAQQANSNSEDERKIVIIKRTVDENGNEVVEEIIRNEGEDFQDAETEVFVIKSTEGDELIKWRKAEGNKMKFHESEVNVNIDEDNGERVITIDIDGDVEKIVLEENETLSDEKRKQLKEHGIVIDDQGEGVIVIGDKERAFMEGRSGHHLARRMQRLADRLDAFDIEIEMDMDDQGFAHWAAKGANCVALGVFVNSGSSDNLRVIRTIDGSGAEEAGIEAGDILRAIDGIPIGNFKELHEVLGAYEPGDVVKVDYERNGNITTVQSELRQWGDLPDYENSWRAQVKCGDPDYSGEFNFFESPKVEKKVIIIKKNKATEEEPEKEEVIETRSTDDFALELDNFVAYPNPTDGKFRIQFEGEPLPLTVSVYDASGQEVYRDKMPYFNGIYNKEVNMTSAPRGLLLISVVQEGKQFTDKIILQ